MQFSGKKPLWRWRRAAAVVAVGISLSMGVCAHAHDLTGGATLAHPQANDAALERASANMAAAAQNFWDALTPELQAKAGFPFDNAERFNWHFIPRERKGITWNDMTPAQQALAHAFLASGLSQRGYEQAVTIMSLDQILKDMEKGKGPRRDPNNYAFSIFGTPGAKNTWGWRVEGHHLSLNFTMSHGRAAAGPVFFGSNPAEVREGPRKGLRVLAAEDDLGHGLINALDEGQRKKAIIKTTAPREIITGNSRKANPGPPVGIAAGELNAQQKKLLMTLVENYAYRLRPELAEQDLAKIDKAGFENIHFAWAGGLQPGQGHYYRLHGPTFLVEFDDTQNNANHIHTVWRDAANDFGEDLLKEHYTENASNPAHGHDLPKSVTPEVKNPERHVAFMKDREELEKHGPIELILEGDSITDGWRWGGKKVFDESYKKYNPFNTGIGGDRTEHLLYRLNEGEIDGLHPKAVMLMIGTNNLGTGQSVDDTIAGVTAVVKTIHEKAPAAKILLLGIFPRGHNADDSFRAEIKAVNEAISKLNGQDNITYLDIGDKFLEPDGTLSKAIMPDFLHPNEKGYEIWAQAVQPTLDGMMK
jgi:lysophospholipase L1-like esterase